MKVKKNILIIICALFSLFILSSIPVKKYKKLPVMKKRNMVELKRNLRLKNRNSGKKPLVKLKRGSLYLLKRKIQGKNKIKTKRRRRIGPIRRMNIITKAKAKSKRKSVNKRSIRHSYQQNSSDLRVKLYKKKKAME